MGTTNSAGPIDVTGIYTLISGVKVVARSADTVQIGTEPPRWLILHRAPADSAAILRRLDGSTRIADVLADHRADPLIWIDVLTRLRDRGLLVSAREWVFPGAQQDVQLDPERSSLVYRHGMRTARRLLGRRRESTVTVRGSGRVASAIAGLLVASGVGHVHQQPDRAVRSADLIAASAAPGLTGVAGIPMASRLGRAPGGRPGRADARPNGHDGDAAMLAAVLRQISDTVRTHPPAAHQHPALVVLAGDIPATPWTAAELIRAQIPHLSVRTQLSSAVVGPLVLPGRSACLSCLARHRCAIDLGWTVFEAGLAEPMTSPAALVWTAASLAVIDALTHLDGIAVPSTVDGTVEWWAGEIAPRRRSWSAHPECECRAAARRGVDPQNDDGPPPI